MACMKERWNPVWALKTAPLQLGPKKKKKERGSGYRGNMCQNGEGRKRQRDRERNKEWDRQQEGKTDRSLCAGVGRRSWTSSSILLRSSSRFTFDLVCWWSFDKITAVMSPESDPRWMKKCSLSHFINLHFIWVWRCIHYKVPSRGVTVHVFILNRSVQDVWFGVRLPRLGAPCDPNNYCQNSLFMSLLTQGNTVSPKKFWYWAVAR